jgi:hypothetical protein
MHWLSAFPPSDALRVANSELKKWRTLAAESTSRCEEKDGIIADQTRVLQSLKADNDNLMASLEQLAAICMRDSQTMLSCLTSCSGVACVSASMTSPPHGVHGVAMSPPAARKAHDCMSSPSAQPTPVSTSILTWEQRSGSTGSGSNLDDDDIRRQPVSLEALQASLQVEYSLEDRRVSVGPSEPELSENHPVAVVRSPLSDRRSPRGVVSSPPSTAMSPLLRSPQSVLKSPQSLRSGSPVSRPVTASKSTGLEEMFVRPTHRAGPVVPERSLAPPPLFSRTGLALTVTSLPKHSVDVNPHRNASTAGGSGAEVHARLQRLSRPSDCDIVSVSPSTLDSSQPSSIGLDVEVVAHSTAAAFGERVQPRSHDVQEVSPRRQAAGRSAKRFVGTGVSPQPRSPSKKAASQSVAAPRVVVPPRPSVLAQFSSPTLFRTTPFTHKPVAVVAKPDYQPPAWARAYVPRPVAPKP